MPLLLSASYVMYLGFRCTDPQGTLRPKVLAYPPTPVCPPCPAASPVLEVAAASVAQRRQEARQRRHVEGGRRRGAVLGAADLHLGVVQHAAAVGVQVERGARRQSRSGEGKRAGAAEREGGLSRVAGTCGLQ